MIKDCCGRQPDFREYPLGWRALCSNCGEYTLGWATKKAAIKAWNKLVPKVVKHRLYTKEEVKAVLNHAIGELNHAISHLT